MVKLMSAVSVAVSMVVALVVTGRPAHSGLPGICVPFGLCSTMRLKELEELKNKPVDLLTYEESKILAKEYVKELPKNCNQMMAHELNPIINNLVPVLDHEEKLELDKLGVPRCWRQLLSLWRQRHKCYSNFIFHLFEYIESRKGRARIYSALGSLSDHLRLCGFEDKYSEALNYIKQNSYTRSHKYNSLSICYESIFLETELWRRGPDTKKAILSIRDLPKILSIPDEAGCNFFKTDLLTSLYNIIDFEPLKSHMIDHLAIALEKSGLEARYKKVMNQHGYDIEKADSPLASYLIDHYLREGEEAKMRYAIHMIDKLASRVDYKPQVGCAIDIRPMKYFELKLETSVDNPFADIVRAELFKEIATMKVNTNSWAFVKKFANLIESEFMPKYKDDPRSSRDIIKGILDSVTKDINNGEWKGTEYDFKTDDFKRDLQANCDVLFGQLKRGFEDMKYDFATASRDNEIMNLMNYLGYCSLTYRGYLVNPVAADLDAPYYPRR